MHLSLSFLPSLVAQIVKNLPANAGDLGSIPGAGHGNPLQYSCLENPMDRGTWWATVHGVTKSQTPLKRLTHTHDPITIFLIVLGLFSVGLFLLLCFLPREDPLVICCKAGLVVLNSLNFCLSGKLLISPSNMKENLAG